MPKTFSWQPCDAWHKRDDSKPEKSDTGEGKRNGLCPARSKFSAVSSRTELDSGHPELALDYMKQLKPFASEPDAVQKKIDELEARIKSNAAAAH